MKEFYIEDKTQNISFSGFMPSNDVDCLPFDYFRYAYAEQYFKCLSSIIKCKCQMEISEQFVRQFAIKQVDEQINTLLLSTDKKPEIHKILTNDTLSFKEQKKLLKGLHFNAADILWLNKEAQELGYLLDIYHEEKFPKKFDEKKKPVVYNMKDDCTIETIGDTEMTEGEMRALLEQRKVVQARIYHKEERWHCFYFTFKGLAGEESGLMGAQPHYHYLSDKSGIIMEVLMQRIKECDMPRSNVHILIDRWEYRS